MPGATGKEVAILDLYHDTGNAHRVRPYDKTYAFIPTAKAIVAKKIRTQTLSGAPVMVMCDPTTVRFYLPFWCSRALDRTRFADCEYPTAECIDFDRCGVQMLEWPFRENCSRKMI